MKDLIMATAKLGDTVAVHYVGTLTDGVIFDESTGRDPLIFTLGGNQVIEGFEQAIIGLNVGDEVNVSIPAEKAYGDIDDNLIFDLPRESFPKEIELFQGADLVLSNPEGEELAALIVEFDDEKVVLDANHPLAGKDLNFKITLVEII